MSPPPDAPAAAAQALLEAELTRIRPNPEQLTPQPLTFAELHALINEIEQSKQRLLCHPDDVERVRRAVAGCGLGLFLIVEPSPFPEPGQAVLAASQRDMEALLEPGTW